MDADKLDELERLLRLATTRPWKANTADKTGEDWLICSLGNSNEDGQDWIVTTDRIHASELDGDAKFDAALIVAAVNALEDLVARARRVAELEALNKLQSDAANLASDVIEGKISVADAREKAAELRARSAALQTKGPTT